MPKLSLIMLILLLLMNGRICAQKVDSTLDMLEQLPKKYIRTIDKKINQYSSRLTGKTENTLIKLSCWENKIKVLLQKASPETAERLFNNNQLTFTGMLQKLKESEAIALQYQAQYDGYLDKLTTDLKYLQTQKENINIKLIQPLNNATKKMQLLKEDEDKSAAIQQFISERKKQLISESVHYIGQSKYLIKINKESFYYIETLKNYKEIFNDPTKAESLVKDLLNRIPSFQQFFRKNSMLSSLFSLPENNGTAANLAGLQTRADVQSLIQDRIASGGPNAREQVQQNIQAGLAELTKLKEKLLSPMQGNGGGDRPDFTIKEVKSKTFMQRLEYGSQEDGVLTIMQSITLSGLLTRMG